MENTNNEDNNLLDNISNEIVSTSIDLATDYAELSIDEIIGEAFAEVPIIKTLLAIGKIGINIKEKRFIKKLLVFLKEFHSGNVDPNELEKFKQKFNSDNKYRDKVTEHIVVFVDSFLQIEKSKIFAKLFHGYINSNYNWEYFSDLSAALEASQPGTLRYLQELAISNFEVPENHKARVVPRDRNKEALLSAAGLSYTISSWSSGLKVSQLGKDLHKFGLANL